MLQYFVAAYDRRYLDKSRPYEGIFAMLKELEAGGVAMAVNSNKRTDYTEKLIKSCFPKFPLWGVRGTGGSSQKARSF